MKILRLRFKNINSLRGEHTIDFSSEPLLSSGLFAIIGPTGSGKTTILDVISLALYNRIPRHNDKISRGYIEKTGAILTRNTEDAYALAEYECPRGRYISKWSISTARTGKLRDYDMELSEVDTKKILDLKKNEIPKRNENLVGLKYDQFIKSILLAQGDFSKFLKSSKDERGDLLEKITGTSIYRELGRLAFEQNKKYGIELFDLRNREAILKEEKVDQEEYNTLKEHIKNITLQLQQQSAYQLSLRKDIDTKQSILQLNNVLRQLKTEKENALFQQAEFDQQHGLRIKKHQLLIPYGDDLNQWNQLLSEKNTIIENHKKLKDQQKQNEQLITISLSNIHRLTQTAVTEINAIDELDFFYDKIEKTHAALKDAVQEFSSIQEQASIVARSINFEVTRDQQDNLKRLEIAQKKNQIEIKKILSLVDNKKLNTPEIQISNNNKSIKDLLIAIEKRKTLQKSKEDLQLQEEEKEKLITHLKELPDKIKHNQKDAKILELELENLNQQLTFNRLSKSLEEHRTHLKEGDPCPLCGALEHPLIQGKKEEEKDTLEDTIKVKNKQKDEVNNALAQLISEQKIHQERQGKLDIFIRQLYEKIALSTQEINQLIGENTKTSLSERLNELESENALLEQWIKISDRQNKYLDLHPMIEVLIEKSKAGKQLKEKLDALYTGRNHRKEIDELKTKWNNSIQERRFLDNHIAELKSKLKLIEDTLSRIESNTLQPLSNLGYSSLQDALQHRIKENEYNQLNNQLNHLKNELGRIEGQNKTLNTQLKEKQELESSKTAEQLNEALKNCESTILEFNNQLIEHQSKFNRQKEVYAQLNELEKSINLQLKHNKKWMLLNQYIGDAQGKNFSTFAQELTLQQLIFLANKRLITLSNRYQLDIPYTSEDDSLIIIDEHMGSMRRSVKTLSGGESFLISLSLALALSDLASRNVEINSLFIDEGFGTLDPETLDQTLDTLEKLQAESDKTIGIISHVSALKERIGTQIQLQRNGQGNSVISIVH